MLKSKNIIRSILILIVIGLSLISCSKKESVPDKLSIESFDYEINRSKSALPNELSYELSFEIKFSLNQKFDVDDLVVRIATTEEAIENKKSFHLDIDYSNTENIIKSDSTEKYPHILLKYAIADTTAFNVEAQIKITSMDLIDDVNKFIKLECYCNSKEIVDEKNILNNGTFKMSFSDDSLTHYEFDDFSESYKIVSVIARTDTFEVPETYKGYPVKTIGEGAFYGYSNLKSLTIPNSVTTIAEDAFEGCDNLEQVTIPAIAIPLISKKNLKEVTITNGTSIERSAFSNCTNLVSITIPDSITSIGVDAFEGCGNIEKATIPTIAISSIPKENLKEVTITSGTNIEKSAFSGCSNLTSVSIGDDVKSIEENTFKDCEKLTNITLPNSLISVGSSAFSGCSSLTNIEIPNHTTSIGNGAFHWCYNLTSITIPNSVTSIGEGAFSHCSNLLSITIPESVTSIESSTFSSCINLSSVVLPESITSVGSNAFSGCSNLISITIPNNVISIGESAFEGCNNIEQAIIPTHTISSIPKENLKEVTITSGTNIELSAFEGSSKLTKVYYDGTLEDWCKLNCSVFKWSSSSSNHFYIRNSTSVWEEVTSIEIPNTITEIKDNQFYGFNNVTSIKIPDNVTSIGKSAFSNCSSLIGITIPNGITNLGEDIFSGCINIEQATIPIIAIKSIPKDNIREIIITSGTNIEESAFSNCNKLVSIILPSGLVSIGSYAFYNCNSLTTITIPAGVTSIGDYAFLSCSSLESIFIPNSVTSIGSYAFCGCSKFTNISIPDSVTSIGESVFSGCINLEKTTIPTIVINSIPKDNLKEVIITSGTTLGELAFAKCTKLTSITLPDTLVSIGDGAFSGCNSLTYITIPNSVTSVGSEAFYDCINLHYNEYDNGYYLGNEDNPYFVLVKSKSIDIMNCEINSNTKFIYGSAFQGCNVLLSIVIPDSVTNIGEDAFTSCVKMVKATIPTIAIKFIPKDSIKEVIITSGTNIEEKAFLNCTSLMSITIPDSVTSIGKDAFSGCINIEKATIPTVAIKSISKDSIKKVIITSGTNIEEKAFLNCTSLMSITIPDSVTSIGKDAFSGCVNIEKATIPAIAIKSIPQNHIKEVIITSGTNIEEKAFLNCSNLESIIIPSSMTNIGDWAFRNCYGLTSITIPDSVTSIGDYAFDGCYKLAEVYNLSSLNIIIGSTSNGYVGYNAKVIHTSLEEETNLITKDDYLFYKDEDNKYYLVSYNGTHTEIVLPNDIDGNNYEINEYAFYECSSISKITIPNSITSIGNFAFDGCYRLSEVYNLSSLNIIMGDTSNGYVGYYAKVIHTSLEEESNLITKDNYLFYKDNENKYYLVSYNGTDTEIVLPNDIEGNKYVINEFAFKDCYNITSITIPNCITSIEDYAFHNCSNIVKVTIPTMAIPFIPKSKLKEVVITEGESIVGHAFSGCGSLTNVTIPESVTSIGEYAFSDCSSLTEVFYEGTIEDWCNIAFNNYSSNPMYYANHFYLRNNNEWEEVTSIEIPNTITKIGDYQFYGFSNVTSITIPDSVTSVGTSAFSRCSSLTNVTIPESVTGIGELAFAECSSLTNVFYEGTIEDWCSIIFNINDYYVYGESSNPMYYANHFYIRNSNNEWEEVTSIEIPNTITKIKAYQFYGFNNVISITIPNGVTSIGDSAFYGCSSLTSITIPDSVISIGNAVFFDCNSLSNVYYEGTIEDWCKLNFNIFDSSSNSNHFYLRNDNNEWEEVTNIEIPNGVMQIGHYQFYGFNNVKSIIIPSSVTSIGTRSFYNCSSLTNITIPESVASIGSEAFEGCSSLTNVYYEKSIEDWCNISFKYFSSNPMYYASHFYIRNSNNEWEEVTSIEIPNTITEIGANQFYGFSNITSITIPNSITSIGENAFWNCSSLTSITIPNSVTSIGGFAFLGCSNLTSIVIPNSVTSILNNAFSGCSSLTSIVIPNSVTSIGESAFGNCSSLTSIIIPSSLTSIGRWVFSNCSSLTNVYYEGGIEEWCKITFNSNDSNPMYYADHFYLKNSNNDWTEVTSIDIPNTITEIGNYQFRGFKYLISITIPNSVTSIGGYAFYECSNLTSIVIANSVTSIGSSAFSNCSSLKEVYYNGTSIEWSNIEISYGNSYLTDATIYYYSETKPTTSGNYWHYVNGVVTKW